MLVTIIMIMIIIIIRMLIKNEKKNNSSSSNVSIAFYFCYLKDTGGNSYRYVFYFVFLLLSYCSNLFLSAEWNLCCIAGADIMEQKHRDRLRSNQVFLVQKLHLRLLFDHLVQTGLLSNNDVERLKVTFSLLQVNLLHCC